MFKFVCLIFLTLSLILPGASTAQPERLLNASQGVTQCKPSLTVDAADGNFRYATVADAAAIPNANVGDYLLDGTNTGNGAIYISTAANWNNSFALGPGKKILIKGGSYTKIYLDIPNVVGSAAEPIVITNYDGQVSSRSLTILGARHFKLTGRYAPWDQTGDENYRGWQSTVGHYQAQFGFDIRNAWTSTTGQSVAIGGNASDYELEYVEAGDGGFAGMMFKTDNGTVDMNNVSIHHNYIHDSDGEGIYLGSTQADPQHQFNNLHIHNNVIARAGLNTLQVGQLAQNVLIEHNVLIMGTINWKNPFMLTQDEAVQFGLRRGGTTFRNNIVVGGAKLLAIGFLSPKTGLPLDPNSPFIVENNLFYGVRSQGAVYLESRGDSVTPLVVRNNYVAHIDGDYEVVFPNHSFDTSWVWAAYQGTVAQMTATTNMFDSTATQPFFRARGGALLTETGTLESAVPGPRFHNFMELPANFDYRTVEKWNPFIGESDRFPADNTNKGDPIVYNLGSFVMHDGYLYRSLQNNNHNHIPTDATDSWWQRVTFQSSGGPCIPDDVRLPADDFYAQQGIGLQQQIPNQATNWLYLPSVQR